jgi:hypothetical protein
MKSTEILNKIKTYLGEEVKEESPQEALELAQLKLENGTVLEADAFESGNEIFILTEDEKVAVPKGEYLMEDGRMLVVEEEGVIEELSSTPAVEPIAHNPEAQEKFKVRFGNNRRETALDRVMKRLTNN